MSPRSTRSPMMSETLAETWHSQIASVPQTVTRLRRRLAAVTAGALALSVVLASAMPVRADTDDDLLAALAALAVIGIVISESDDDDDKVEHYDNDGYRPAPYPQPYPTHNIRIPAACAIEVEGRDHREVVFYAESCLRKYGVRSLPNACSREVKFYGRKDWVYGEACLRNAGYRLDTNAHRDHERPD